MKQLLSLILFFVLANGTAKACSVLYYVDSVSGKIYAVNNEDFWYDVKASIHLIPAGKKGLARMWYGWDHFAQGGVNQAGLFFDGAATPEEKAIAGYHPPKGNLGDRILARCRNVEEALSYLEQEKIALTNGHLLFGDATGNAAVVEWVNGQKTIVPISGNRLMITNFLLSDPAKGNYPCPRYSAMENELDRLRAAKDTVDLKTVGDVLAKAVQPKAANDQGKEGGTLYSTFINLTDIQFLLVYQLDNTRRTQLDLKKEFAGTRKRVIRLG